MNRRDRVEKVGLALLQAVANKLLREAMTKEHHWRSDQTDGRRRGLRKVMYQEGVENRTVKEVLKELRQAH